MQTESQLTDFRHWLEANGLGEYAKQFAANEIDFDLVSQLTDSDLGALGLSVGAKRRLALALQALDAADSPARVKPSAQVTSAERRQLTVLFCDMAGFTELASRLDPEILDKIIRVYEDTCAAAITRYEGHVFQRLGDGIVAFFGYPLAHEDEAARAIHAGLDIVDALASLDVAEVGHLQVRIGVATGVVVVSSVEKGAVGETMNLASRLQGVAQVNTVVVSERVQQLAAGAFDYEDMGEQALKGIARPTHAYRVVGVSEVASRFDAAHGKAELTPLVGRKRELGLLMERWRLAQDGAGQVVLLSGEAGIGKSRTLSELRERLQSNGAQSLYVHCSAYYVNSALWPTIDNFERALKFVRDETPESKLDKLESLVVGHYGRPLSDVRFVASMLSIPCEGRYGTLSITPQKFKDETLRTLVDITEAAARERPTVLLYEDLQWADPTTLAALDLLIERVKNIPLLIVLTHRPEFQSRWSGHDHVISLNLSRITRVQSSELVSSVTGGKALPSDLLEDILVKTDGVPLFVEELTKSILESGALKDAGNRYDYSGTARTVHIPATLRDSLMARLDRYVPVKQIAQIGAVIGRNFRYELIAAVAPMAPAQLDEALEQLTGSGLAFRRGKLPDAVFSFKHALVQDAAYDSLLKSRRRELHGNIARVIEARFPNVSDAEPELLAHHLTAAGETAAAIRLWHKAGEIALKRVALSESLSHLSRGLDLVATLPHSPEGDASELALRATAGTATVALKGWPAAEVGTHLSRALSLVKSLGRTDASLPVLWGLRTNLMSRGRLPEALSLAQELLNLAEQAGEPDLLSAGHASTCVCYFSMGRLVNTMAHADKLMAIHRDDEHRHLVNLLNQDPKTSVGVCVCLATWMLGYPDRAVRLYDETITHARQLGHPFNLGFALTQGATLFNLRCEPEQQRKRAEECGRLGRDNSIPLFTELITPVHLGVASVRAGRYAEGIKLLKTGLAVWDASGGKLSAHAWAVLAEAMARTGNTDDALHLLDEQIAQIEHPDRDERAYYAEMLRLRGWMLTLKADVAAAETSYLASLDWAREQQAKSWELRTSTSLAQLWQQQGKRKVAYELLAPVYDWFTEGFDTKDLKEAKALLDELSV